MSRAPRKKLILEALARELELNPGGRITTASLAKAAGVSEAALYRHFASKARMFEGLIDFAEESIFVRINQIMQEERDAQLRCGQLLYLLLAFSDRNPGITRVLLGDALVGETERLLQRVAQFFARLETQLRQILREGEWRQAGGGEMEVGAVANLLLAVVEGRMHQYLRSRFETSPLEQWEAQWGLLQTSLFNGQMGAPLPPPEILA
ncbi:MAG: nucleoid occlusion factor SlmA [Gammaproteobacteria bacterium]|nr:nucleoid occlusion factor SlmA [Gammaproteobacteria bacterium]